MSRYALLTLVLVTGCQATDPGFPGGESFTLHFPAVEVVPGFERTQCVILPLGNTHAIHVGSIENVLGEGSHHLIVYKTSETTARTRPFDCAPFVETLDPSVGSPLMVSQRRDDLLTLPPGVAFDLDANQMVRLEMHYINTTEDTLSIEASSTFHTIADADFHDSAAFLFIGTPDIFIPAHSTTTVGPVYFALPPELGTPNFFAITGHAHHLGTDVRVWSSASASATPTPVYDVSPWLWSEPQTVVHDPPLVLPPGGGFQFQCDYENTGDTGVSFGESANAEMCFFWAYYYPSHGPLVCMHITTTPTPQDICCPGSDLCPILLGMR